MKVRVGRVVVIVQDDRGERRTKFGVWGIPFIETVWGTRRRDSYREEVDMEEDRDMVM